MKGRFAIFAACILAWAAPAARAEWPDHPIRFIVGFGPGGANDLIARFAAEGVLANNVAATSEASIVVLPKIKAGLLKAIATTYTQRISAYPSIPTTAEQGYPAVQIGHWAGLYPPAGTPEPVILNAALQEALKTDKVRNKLIPTGIEPAGGSVEDFVKFTKAERQRLSDLATKIKVTKEK